MGTAVQLPVPPPQKHWFRENRRAVVIGSLGFVLFGAVFIVGVTTFVMSMFKNSEPYQQAVARAQRNPAVIQKLGSPVTPKWFSTGSIEVSTNSGDADMGIPLLGPKGKGTVYVVAKKIGRKWEYTTMLFEDAASGERIDLLDPATPASPSTANR